MVAVNFWSWWSSDPLAQRLKREESLFLSRALTVPYTSVLVQLGVTGFEGEYLDSGYRDRFFPVEERPIPGVRVVSHLATLPIASESVDVAILPHTLERVEECHQLLREVERILKPEGVLLVAGFYPLNLYRLCRFRLAPWLKQTLSARRLLDWLELLNFAASVEAQFQLTSGKVTVRLARLTAIGYGIRAVKRSYAAIPLKLDPAQEHIPAVSEAIHRIRPEDLSRAHRDRFPERRFPYGSVPKAGSSDAQPVSRTTFGPSQKASPVHRSKVVIYTDGACRGNPGPGGWAALIQQEGEERTLCGFAPETTNNRMELLAAIRALEALEEPSRVELYTDSSYLKLGITEWLPRWKARGWRRLGGGEVKNLDLWRRLDELCQKHQVEWHWIRGHSGHPENERVDQLARLALEEGLRSVGGR